jgi:hypothetical protein
MAELFFEMLAAIFEAFVDIFIEAIGRTVLWLFCAGQRPWSEFDETFAKIVGVLFVVLLFVGIAILVW